jgi:hypothetical protein
MGWVGAGAVVLMGGVLQEETEGTERKFRVNDFLSFLRYLL